MMRPETEADLAEVVATAVDPLAIVGGGTRGMAPHGTPLETGGLNGITRYEPGALTLVAQAGTPLSDIETALAAEKQMLAFEPMDHRALVGTLGEPTIGGVVAANVSGPRRARAGACRDYLLGVRFVDGRGEVVKNGGRVMKNVTGYDLTKLMCGAHGTLGVLTEVSFKTLPVNESSATLRITGLPGTRGLEAMSRAMKSPFEVNGAVHSAEDVYLRIEGFESSVGYRAKALVGLLKDFGEIQLETDNEINHRTWAAFRDVHALRDHAYVWKVAMKPGALYAGVLGQALQSYAFDTLVDWAGGLAWVGLTHAQANAGDDTAVSFHETLQAAVSDPVINDGGGGHATLVKATDTVARQVARFQPEAPPLAALANGLRQKFDPKGLLNRGLMG